MAKLTEKLVLARARSKSLESVKNLNCWGNGLTDVSILSQLENVEVVNASANNIEGLQAFSHCCHLRELYLRKNQIKNLNEILHLKKLSHLRILWLSGNPCCENVCDEKYRLTVIKALPMLTKLDNVAISIEELKRAQEEGEDLNDAVDVPEDSKTDKQKLDPAYNNDDGVQEESVDEKGEKESAAEKKSKEDEEKHNEPENKENEPVLEKETSSDEKSRNDVSDDMKSETKTTFAVDETNELRRQLGLKPLPKPSAGMPSVKATAKPRTLGQSTTSVNVLNATLALIKEMDEEALVTIRDAVQDRLYMIRREEGSNIEEISETSRSSNLTNDTSSPEKNDNKSPEIV